MRPARAPQSGVRYTMLGLLVAAEVSVGAFVEFWSQLSAYRRARALRDPDREGGAEAAARRA